MFKRSTLFIILLVILAVIAVQTGRRLIFSMVYLLGATLLFSFLWSWANLRAVSISRLTQSLRAQVGRPIEERIVVRNQGWLPKLWLEIRDGSELPGHHASRVINGLPPRRSRGWSIKTNARRRGRYRLGPMQLVSGDPFGLFTLKRDLPQTSSITIYPATYDLPRFHPPVGRLLGGESIRRRTHNVTPNFAGVRDYVPGDTFSRIHWRSTARTGRLIVKEFEEDPTADIWIVLDMYHAAHFEAEDELPEDDSLPSLLWLRKRDEGLPPSTTDYAVTVAASLFKHFLELNRAVGMVAHAEHREIMQPDRGLRPLTRALEHLAVLEAYGNHTLADVITLEEKFFERGNTVIVVTPSANVKWVNAAQELQRRGVQVIAILINGSSFSPRLPRLDDVRASLAINGVPTYVVNNGDAIPEALGTPAGANPLRKVAAEKPSTNGQSNGSGG
jgi:uncharacterized protein (DUF58 family)